MASPGAERLAAPTTFLRSRDGITWLVLLAFAAVLAIAAAYGFHEASLRSFMADKTDEEGTALQLVEAFVDNYSNVRGRFDSGDAPVPSTFRAHSIELFNHNRGAAGMMRLRWIGREGRSIATPPADAQMAATIESFVGEAKPRPVAQFLTVGGEQLFRTVYPSVAREQSCVDCHNTVQPDQHWQVNDVMGAFSLDVPADAFLRALRLQCVAIALVVFLLVGGVGLWITRSHHHRVIAMMATQNALRAHQADLDRTNRELGETVAALRASSQRFKDLADVSVDWVWDTDENHRFTQLIGHENLEERQLLKNVLGRTRWEVIGVDPAADAHWAQHKTDLDAHRPFRRFRYEVIALSGRRLHSVVSGKPVFDDNGDFRGYRGTATDETTMVEAQRRAQDSEALLSDAINTTAGGFIIYDANDRIVVCNEMARRVAPECAEYLQPGKSFEEYLRAAVELGFFRAREENTEAWIIERLKSHREAKGSVELQTSRGWLLVTERRMSNGGIASVALDTTGLHEAQRRAKELEQQLAQSQKMEALGNLTGGMAHDFNNLLGIIVGNLDLLRSLKTGDAEVEELAGDALEAAIRGADLTRGLLAFARQQPIQTQRVELNRLVCGITRLLRRTLGEHVDIVTDLSAAVWPVVVDPVQLESSLANLATNARDAMPKGGTLTIATGNHMLGGNDMPCPTGIPAGDYAVIEVSDTGIGMPPEVLARVFEPFYTTKPFGKGTGLGLSMVFGFARQSGGHIQVESEPGNGTTFRLYLPRALDNAVIATVSAQETVAGGTGETVLVVEDNTFLRRVVARQLTEMGYRVVEAENAAAGLDILDRQSIDLLFTDIVMPGGIDGVELARQVCGRWPNVRVILTTGFSESPLNRDIATLLPDASLLRKPYRKSELAATLRAAVDTRIAAVG